MRRVLVPAVMAALVVGAAALAWSPEPHRPLATVGHAGAEPATTTTPAPAPVPTTTTTKPAPKVAATRSTTVVRSGAGGLTVVNDGSATASSGGNTVVGPPSAHVAEGPVTAVGNTAKVRIRP